MQQNGEGKTSLIPATRAKPSTLSMVTPGTQPSQIAVNLLEDRITTVISERSALSGDFSFEEGLKIDGIVRGDITFGTEDGLCIVSRSAIIEGNLKGPRALILGNVVGDVTITGTIIVAAGATVSGNITYGRLVVYDGATISGSMTMSNGGRPIEHAPASQDYPESVVRLNRAQA